MTMKTRDRKCSGRKGGGCDYKRATGRILVMELFRILTVVIDTNVIKLHRTQYTIHTHTHTIKLGKSE